MKRKRREFRKGLVNPCQGVLQNYMQITRQIAQYNVSMRLNVSLWRQVLSGRFVLLLMTQCHMYTLPHPAPEGAPNTPSIIWGCRNKP